MNIFKNNLSNNLLNKFIMNIIDIYDKLKSSYKNYIGSFVSIKDERIKQKVSEAIQDEKLWPKALIQFN